MASSGNRFRYSGRPTRSKHDPRDAAPQTKHTVQLHLWRQCHVTAKDVFEEVLEGDPEHGAVAHSAQLALDLLRGADGRKVLADIGNDAVKKWSPRQHIYDDRPDQMLGWVDFFLRWLERDFVNVELQTRSPYDGSFLPCDWYKHGDEGMKAWRPDIAGTIRLNYFMIKSMAEAGDQNTDEAWETYHRFLLILGVTIAHELVHCFMGFLSGTEKADTPRDMAGMTTGFGADCEWGDSGTVWECRVLGGYVKSYEDPHHPLRGHQAGIPWLTKPGGRIKEIAIKYGHEPHEPLDLSVPLETVGRSYTVEQVNSMHRPMEEVRYRMMEKAGLHVQSMELHHRPSPRPRYKAGTHTPAPASTPPVITNLPTTGSAKPVPANLNSTNKKGTSSLVGGPAKRAAAPRTAASANCPTNPAPGHVPPAKSSLRPGKPALNQANSSSDQPKPPSNPAEPLLKSGKHNSGKVVPEVSPVNGAANRAPSQTGSSPGSSSTWRPKLRLKTDPK